MFHLIKHLLAPPIFAGDEKKTIAILLFPVAIIVASLLLTPRAVLFVARLFAAVDVTPPAALPRNHQPVATKQKLPSQRKKQ